MARGVGWWRRLSGKLDGDVGLLAFMVVVVLALLFGREPRTMYSRAEILDAIRMVESGGRARPPDGDGGRAIGPYQIHREYWQDAVAAAPGLGGSYQRCREQDYAEAVIDAYMTRWATAAWADGHAEVIARIHNGGPRGAQLEATEGYWGRVRAQLTGGALAPGSSAVGK
ncbi:MAG: hypothetical protein AAF628_28830 [Planctomycetota bacterium]